MKFIPLFFAFLMIVTSCASTTVIQSEPSGADVYIDNQKKGKTPYTYSDTKIAGSSTYITLKKDGYEDFETVLVRNEQADVGAIVGGCFLLFPFLWTMKYHPTHNYELEKSEEENTETTTTTTNPNSTNELIKLKNLLDEEAITQDEFTTLKVKILQDNYDYENSIADQIKELRELYNQDLLTLEEYNAQKKKLIERE